MLPTPKDFLVLLLRFVAGLLLLAAIAIVMPFAWMAALHQGLGLGGLPELPIIQYLTRSTSALYATWGALFLYLSFDVRRHLALIRFLMLVKLAFAAVMFAIDVWVGMPWYWTICEGPPIMVVAAVIYGLAQKVQKSPARGRPR